MQNVRFNVSCEKGGVYLTSKTLGIEKKKLLKMGTTRHALFDWGSLKGPINLDIDLGAHATSLAFFTDVNFMPEASSDEQHVFTGNPQQE